MATLYYISPFGQTGWILRHISALGAPVLNSKLGDLVHTDRAAADALALNIARDAAVDDKGIDVLELEVPDAIYEGLVRHGEIRPKAQLDYFNAELTAISPLAAEALNGCLSFIEHRLMRPEKLN
jgi:hypothetical protein